MSMRERKVPERFQGWNFGDKHEPFSIRNQKKTVKEEVATRKANQANYREMMKSEKESQTPLEETSQQPTQSKVKMSKKQVKDNKQMRKEKLKIAEETKKEKIAEKQLKKAERRKEIQEKQKQYRNEVKAKKIRDMKKQKVYLEAYRKMKKNKN